MKGERKMPVTTLTPRENQLEPTFLRISRLSNFIRSLPKESSLLAFGVAGNRLTLPSVLCEESLEEVGPTPNLPSIVNQAAKNRLTCNEPLKWKRPKRQP